MNRGHAYAAPVALPHAILVSLCEQSSSGYDLARRFDRSIGFFWAATHQQIYRTLRAMEHDGWVHVAEVAQHGRPDKKVYTRLRRRPCRTRTLDRRSPGGPGGRSGTVSDIRTRDLAVKIRGAAHGDIDALRAQVGSLRSERAELLDAYRGFEKSQFPDPAAVTGTDLHQYLVLRGGIRAEESAVEWLDEVSAATGG